jgi:ATP-dependent DNA ligase
VVRFQVCNAALHAAHAAVQVTVAVCVYAFDLLYVDGEMLVHLPLRQRRVRMAQVRFCTSA